MDSIGQSMAKQYETETVENKLRQITAKYRLEGEAVALASGASKSNPDDVQRLTESVAAESRKETPTRPFSPEHNSEDALRKAEYKKSLEDREEAETAAAIATQGLREATEAAQNYEAEPSTISVPFAIQIFALIVVSLSMAPTLFDRLFRTLPDRTLGWAASFTAAAFVGALITFAMLSIDSTGKKTTANLGGFWAGIGLAMSTLLIRVAYAHTGRDYVFAFGFTLLEASTVIFLEWIASGLREQWHARNIYIQERNPRLAAKAAAAEVLTRRTTQLLLIQAAIQQHIEYVEWKDACHYRAEQIVAACVQAALQGYQHGIDKNKGIRVGLVAVK